MKTISCANNDHVFCPGWFREDLRNPEWSNQICECPRHDKASADKVST